MVPLERIEWIRRLLAEGVPYRAIAKTVRVSRMTIAAIASGVQLPAEAIEKKPRVSRGGLVAKCSGCGATVEMPCLVCRDRKALRGRLMPTEFDPPADFSLELAGEYRERYEEIRPFRLS